MIDYRGVIPKELATGPLWPQLAALLERSLPYGRGEYTLEDLRDGIAAGEIFAIGAVCAGRVAFVATCALITYPRKTVLYVQHGAGRDGAALYPTLIDAARTLGADWIETRTRASVARLYARLGFDVGYVTPILELPENLDP